MNTETLDRLEALLAKASVKPLLLGANPYQDAADMRAHERLIKELNRQALNALPALLSIARRAADVEAIRAVTAKASSEWTGPNPAEFATGVAFVTKPHFAATAVSRYVMGETT